MRVPFTRMIPVLLNIIWAIHTQIAYDPALGAELVTYFHIAYEKIADIRAWNCGLCRKSFLTEVVPFRNKQYQNQGFLGYNPVTDSVIVSFRGSQEIVNFFSDVTIVQKPYKHCGNCRVHGGFLKAWKPMEKFIFAMLNAMLSAHPTARIIIGGHSLGGALAVLCAARLALIMPTTNRPILLYTAGQPRIGNLPFVNWISTLGVVYYRIVNRKDPITHLVATEFYYFHAGYEVWYEPNQSQYYVCAPEEADCSNSIPNATLLISLDDHQYWNYLTIPPNAVRVYLRSPDSLQVQTYQTAATNRMPQQQFSKQMLKNLEGFNYGRN